MGIFMVILLGILMENSLCLGSLWALLGIL